MGSQRLDEGLEGLWEVFQDLAFLAGEGFDAGEEAAGAGEEREVLSFLVN